jgi:hypothetical protein
LDVPEGSNPQFMMPLKLLTIFVSGFKTLFFIRIFESFGFFVQML